MTRFRPVYLCLVPLLCLSVAAPAMAAGPHVVPSGLVETLNGLIGSVLACFGVATPSG